MILTQILRHSFNAVLKLIFFLSKNILLSPLLNLDLSQRVGLLLLQTTVFNFPVNTSRVYVGRPPLLPQQEARVHWRRGPSSGGHRQTACVYPLYLGCRCECLLDIRPEDSHAVCLRAGHQPAEGKLGQGCASILGFTANRGVHPLCLKREKHFSLLDSGEVLNNICFGTETESLLFVHPASRWGGGVGACAGVQVWREGDQEDADVSRCRGVSGTARPVARAASRTLALVALSERGRAGPSPLPPGSLGAGRRPRQSRGSPDGNGARRLIRLTQRFQLTSWEHRYSTPDVLRPSLPCPTVTSPVLSEALSMPCVPLPGRNLSPTVGSIQPRSQPSSSAGSSFAQVTDSAPRCAHPWVEASEPTVLSVS